MEKGKIVLNALFICNDDTRSKIVLRIFSSYENSSLFIAIVTSLISLHDCVYSVTSI